MKNKFTLASCMAMMNIVLITQVHAQDTAIARIDSKKSSKSVAVNEVNANRQVEKSAPTSTVTASPAFDVTVVRKTTDRSILNNKVGPNGEDLIMKKNKYFYFNDKGKKVKVKNSMLRDRPKHS